LYRNLLSDYIELSFRLETAAVKGVAMLSRAVWIVGVFFFVAASILAMQVHAQSRTVFAGIPAFKVSEGGLERHPEKLFREQAVNLGCVISEISGKYYWATRDNKEMVRWSGGAFITFTAIDGSGYVRIVDANAKSAASLMSPTEASFDYVEHLLIGLRSVTYFGNRR